MDIKNKGFTLIEILVVLAVSVSLLVVMGGIMTSTFKAKNNSINLESISSEANSIFYLLKKNVFEADSGTISCPVGVGVSISFETKTGGFTRLWCDVATNKIASVSAESGVFSLNSSSTILQNCDNFVTCQTNDAGAVSRVDFNLNIGKTGGELGSQFWNFVSKVTVR